MVKREFNIHNIFNNHSLDESIRIIYNNGYTIDDITSELYNKSITSPIKSSERLYSSGSSMTYRDSKGNLMDKPAVISYIELKTAFDTITKAYLGKLSKEHPKKDEQVKSALKLKYKISYAISLLTDKYDFLNEEEKESFKQSSRSLREIMIAEGFREDTLSLEKEVNERLYLENNRTHHTRTERRFFSHANRSGSISIPYFLRKLQR